MSIIIGGGVLISYMESELECPICTFKFDASEKMDKAKYPVFNTRCPACKGKIVISMPIMGGTTRCYEQADSPNIERLETTALFEVNGIPIKNK